MGQCTSIKKFQLKNENRAFSSSHTLDNETELKPSVIKKSKKPGNSSRKLILASLQKHYLFSTLTQNNFEYLFLRLFYISYLGKEVVFAQGDPGDLFYIIESGKVEVIRNGVKKAILQEGDSFGDMALLTNLPRRATLQTLETTNLWGLSKHGFTEVLSSINKRNFDVNKDFISKLKIFSNLPMNQINKLTEIVIEQNFTDDQRIICEGDEGLLLYIVKNGEAVAKIKGVECFRLGNGELFGESVVFGDNSIRKYSVYSVKNVSVLSLSRDDIISIIGEDFKEILYKNQVKNSLLSDDFAKLLSKDAITSMISSLSWRYLFPDNPPIPNPIVERAVYIICLGSLKSSIHTYIHGEILGFLSKKIKLQVDEELVAETETILGVISIENIENATRMEWNSLKKRLKIIKFLRKLEIFAEISQSKLRNIAMITHFEEFQKKDIIFKCNEEAKCFYIIKRGGIKIIHNGKGIRMLGKYDIFGDNCLHEETRATAAKALSYCKCLVIDRDQFKEIIGSEDEGKFKWTKSHLSNIQLYQLTVVKCISHNGLKICFTTYAEDLDIFYYTKAINKNQVDTVEKFQKLLNEKKIAISVEHPLMARLVKTFSDKNFAYMLYENFSSIPFSSILNKPLVQEHAKLLTACLVSMLEYFHEKNILFREFNPNTVSINSLGYPFISDFSSAKIVTDRTNTKIGDILYTAPEVLTGSMYNKSINLWSLGVMIYQFLYNKIPFGITNEDSPLDICSKVIDKKIIFPLDSKYIITIRWFSVSLFAKFFNFYAKFNRKSPSI